MTGPWGTTYLKRDVILHCKWEYNYSGFLDFEPSSGGLNRFYGIPIIPFPRELEWKMFSEVNIALERIVTELI